MIGDIRVTLYSRLPYGLTHPGVEVGTLIRYNENVPELIYWRPAKTFKGEIIIGIKQSNFAGMKFRGHAA
jgi:hypothetical protein